ncbi:MAG: DUF4410 domain-containing protein [Campylobacterales bacterium]|nr:DUF4410 domain-containing protein [Campylobacterales bacterium]
MKNIISGMTKYTLAGFTGILIFSGCTATSAPEPTNMKAQSKEFKIDANDVLTVSVNSNPDVTITEDSKHRIEQKIVSEINTHKLQNTNVDKVKKYHLAVQLTKYDKGNAFARMMLAGLGQIHIDSNTNVLVLPQKTKVAEFTLDKTFAWGGLYGAGTTIETVEDGFAKGIAEAVTLTKEKK